MRFFYCLGLDGDFDDAISSAHIFAIASDRFFNPRTKLLASSALELMPRKGGLKTLNFEKSVDMPVSNQKVVSN